MNSNLIKVLLALAGSSSASLIAYLALGSVVGPNLHPTEYSLLRDDVEFEVNDNNHETNLDVVKFQISTKTNNWQCYLNGKPDSSFNNGDKSKAQKGIENELKELFVGSNKGNNKWRLMQSCSFNRKNLDQESLEKLISGEVSFEIEKSGDKWKIKDSDRNSLLSGTLKKKD